MARHMKVWYTEASLKSLCDDASTMLRTWKRLIALSWPRLEPETKEEKDRNQVKPSQKQAKSKQKHTKIWLRRPWAHSGSSWSSGRWPCAHGRAWSGRCYVAWKAWREIERSVCEPPGSMHFSPERPPSEAFLDSPTGFAALCCGSR